MPQSPGLGDVLNTARARSRRERRSRRRRRQPRRRAPSRGELRALPSGDPSQHPAALLAGESLGSMFEELGRSEYRYVLVEGPPLLGPIDGQLVARWADAVLVVCRLDRLSPDEATELGDKRGPARRARARRRLIGGGRVRYSLPADADARDRRLPGLGPS